ncbi:MAG: hypothetical protein COC01_07090 [Bacteroidetes bacterium]|nr:MAG: hypothetical protein COC01_07090 [Bacteroidota bacterium]
MIRSKLCRYSTFFCFIFICNISYAQKPEAGFYVNKTEGCAPLQVSFFDTSSNSPNAWRWDFGDGGAVSFVQNPKRTYDIPGTYTIEFIATNADGSDTVTITNHINVYDIPTADYSATPPSGCAPLIVQFTDQSTTGSGAIVKWQWFMGDGEIDSIPDPQHTYTGNKNYNVTLIITDEFGCSNSKVDQIATVQPTAAFSVNNSSICEDTLTVKFTNSSSSSGIDTLTYNWDFGDATFSTDENPEHFYSDYGSYNVTLTTTEAGCTDNATITISLIDFQPGFEAEDTVICLGAAIKFTDSTANSGTKTWFWGDGKKTTTTGTTINKTYQSAGTYTVQMIVNSSGNACQQTVSRTNYIVVNPVPDVKFSVDDSIPCQKGTVLNFSDNFSGTDTLMWIIWNRPDTSSGGIILSEPVRDTLYGSDPSWNALVEDSFNVILTVKDQNGCESSITKNEYIILKDPEAYISASDIKDCIPLEVFFSDNNSFAYFGDSVISYSWEFIDPFATGATSANGDTASYTWDSAGIYFAKFRIETMRGCTAINYQNVYPGKKPKADMSLPSFTANGVGVRDTSICYNSTIWFRDSSQGIIDEYLWTIPYLADSNNDKQGNESGLQVQYLFIDTLGYFDIVHIVGYHECYDTVIYTAITDTSVDMSTMPDSVIRINIMGPIPGFRSDSLIFISDTLLTAQDTFYLGKDTIYISADQEITGPDTTFIAAAYDTFYTATDTILIPNTWSFTVNAIDTFTVKADTIYNNADTVITSADTIYLPPDTVYISAGQEVIACPDTIIVKFQSEAILADSIIWVLEYPNDTISGHPDSVIRDTNIIKKGTFGTYGSPFHIYEGPGYFSVMQQVYNGSTNCGDVELEIDLIKISALESRFEIDTLLFCKSQPATFKDTSVSNIDFNLSEDNYINLIKWDFGDGTTLVYDRSTLIYPAKYSSTAGRQFHFDSTRKAPFTHAFQKTGELKISHYVYDDLGCVDSSSKKVVVKGTEVNFVADTLIGCEPFTVNFTDLSTGTDSIYDWKWIFGDGDSSINPEPRHIYINSGEYNVKLTTLNRDQCMDTLLRTTYVKCLRPEPKFTISDNTKCEGLDFSFDAKTTTGDRLKYIWIYGDGSYEISSGTNATHSYENDTLIYDSTYTVSLIAIDSLYNCYDTYQKTVIVESPIAGFDIDTSEGCLPLPVQFFDTSLTRSNAVYWLWDVGDGNTFEGTGAGQQFPFNVYTSPGIYDVSLKIVSAEGCTSQIAIDSLIIVKGANITPTIQPFAGCVPLVVKFDYDTDNKKSIDSLDFGDGIVVPVNSDSVFYHTYTSPQTFKPILVIIDGTCEIPFTLDLISADKLNLNSTTDSVVFCNLGTYQFVDQSYNEHPGSYINSWQWELVGDTVINDSVALFTSTKPGEYQVIHTVTTSYGCIETDTTTFTIFSLPDIAVSLSGAKDCVPFTVDFNADLTNAYDSTYRFLTSYFWDFGDGTSDTTFNPSHLYEVGGIYDPVFYFSLFDTVHSYSYDTIWNSIDSNKIDAIDTTKTIDTTYVCNYGKQSDSSITLYNIPYAGFSMDTMITGTLNPFVQFYDSSFVDENTPHTWSWDFGDPASGNDNFTSELDPEHRYSAPGYYTVSLIVRNAGCADTIIQIILAQNNEKFNPPDNFTPYPSSPGVNDVFFIKGLPERSHLIIYNRWGQEVFKSAESGYLNNWDGGGLPGDVYYYVLINEEAGLQVNGFVRIFR